MAAFFVCGAMVAGHLYPSPSSFPAPRRRASFTSLLINQVTQLESDLSSAAAIFFASFLRSGSIRIFRIFDLLTLHYHNYLILLNNGVYYLYIHIADIFHTSAKQGDDSMNTNAAKAELRNPPGIDFIPAIVEFAVVVAVAALLATFLS